MNRREVVHVEAVRVVAAVPADDVERMVGVVVAVDAVAGLDADFEGTLLIEGERKLGQSEIPFAIGSMLEELAGLLRDVSRRGKDVGAVGRLEDDELRIRFILRRFVEDHPIDGPLGDHDVVLGSEGQRAELAVQGAASVVDEEALITLAVLVVIRHGVGRHADRHLDIGVAHHDDASGDGVALRRHGRGREIDASASSRSRRIPASCCRASSSPSPEWGGGCGRWSRSVRRSLRCRRPPRSRARRRGDGTERGACEEPGRVSCSKA